MAYLLRKNNDGSEVYASGVDLEIKEVKQAEDGKRTISMVASTPSVDRDGDTIKQTGWDLAPFKANPVILWGHNHDIPAIGRGNKFKKTKDALVFDEIEFPKEGIHKFADMIFSLMQDGFIKAGSVGFIPTDFTPRKTEEDEPSMGFFPTDFKKQELLEFSVVNVGSNRDALVTSLTAKGFKTNGKVKLGDKEFEMSELINAMFAEDKEDKTVIPFKHYPLADEETAWDGPKERREADVDQLKKMSTWFDSEAPDVKGSYKLPHHQASDLKTVLRGANAAIGAILGARGGVDIPEESRRPAYNHLAKHIREYGKEPPEFKAYEEAELKELFPELFEEKDADDLGVKITARYCVVVEDKDTFVDVPLEFVDATEWKHDESKAPEGWKSMQILTTTKGEPTLNISLSSEKSGAVLSKANKTKLKDAIKLIGDVVASSEPAVEDEGNIDDTKYKPPEGVSEGLKEYFKGILEAAVTDLKATLVDTKKPPIPNTDPLKQEVNLDELKIPEKKEDKESEIDTETFSKFLDGFEQSIKEAVSSEIKKVTGKVD